MADVSRSWRGDDRGVSTALGYVLNVGVAAILVTMLLFSAGSLVETQRDRAVETELRVVGDRVAADLAAADTLARASDGGSVRYTVEAPSNVAGFSYDVHVNESGNGNVVLDADRSAVTITVEFQTEIPVENATVSGGDFVVVYEGNRLEVEDA
ncbi:DUF7266 family protein [Halobacterium noricense]|uniref:DUF7266 family protein n=1 Tax=Halobacterium noricense TaxID=223182 RepID=UPI001E2B6845|nr:hypothetical protein [Halobacterium noricense]UHH26112.1 hypothetical protein LT974_04060 [Halobacterium noricense]